MKYLIVIFFTLLSFLALSQSSIEQSLDNAEQELFRIEQEREKIKELISTNGKTPQRTIQLDQANNLYKIQLKKTKALRKEYKKIQQLESKQASPNNIPQSKPITNPNIFQPSKQNVDKSQEAALKEANKQRKKEIKAKKNELKTLQAERREIVIQAQEAGQNPFTSEVVQDYDRRIIAAQQSLIDLENSPLDVKTTSYPLNNNPQVVAPVKPQIAKETAPIETPTVHYPVNNEATPVEISQPNIEIPQIGLTTILFPKFSTSVPEDYKTYLNYVAKQLQDNPSLNLKIDAYTDNSEKNRMSAQITQAMVGEVAQAMVNRGVSPSRLLLEAHGSKDAVGDNKTFFGQARNRRVELKFVVGAN